MAKYHEVPEVDKIIQEELAKGTKYSDNEERNLALITFFSEKDYEEQTHCPVPRYPFMPESAAAKGARHPIQATTGMIKLFRTKSEQAEKTADVLAVRDIPCTVVGKGN